MAIAKPPVSGPNALASANGARMHARIPKGGSGFNYCGASSAPLKSLDIDLTLLTVVLRPVRHGHSHVGTMKASRMVMRKLASGAALATTALMTAGGLAMAFAPGWGGQVAGRIVAGIGGVLLNVLMSKMVTDWFAGKEIATAMAIFVNSWPAGIALCLFVLPALAAAQGITSALLLTTAFCALGFVLLATLYRPPEIGRAHV